MKQKDQVCARSLVFGLFIQILHIKTYLILNSVVITLVLWSSCLLLFESITLIPVL